MSKSRKCSSPNTPWPQSQDFNEAIQSPGLSFQDSVLKQGTTVLNPLGLPVVASGNFADVYKINCSKTGQNWAVKCFTRQIPGRLEHYRHISAHLQQSRLSCFVEFRHLPQGICVRGKWYPILKMEWYEGIPLNEFVRRSRSDSSLLLSLLDRWIELSRQLRVAQLAHGDLQHGNILVSQQGATSLDVKLVDYDGLFVPAVAGTKPVESGHPAYQHPLRPQEALSRIEVDNFPHLVIACALRALAINGPALWDRYDNGDNLLFTQQDFISPQDSRLFQELWQSSDQLTRFLAAQLILSADRPLGQEPFLADLLPTGPVPVVTPTDERQVTSILARKSIKPVSQPNSIPQPSRSNKTATSTRPTNSTQKQPAAVQTTPTATVGPQPSPSPTRPTTVAIKTPFPWLVATGVVVALLLTFTVRWFRNQSGPTMSVPPMEMTRIPSGEFLMGSHPSEPGRDDDEGPQHLVKITEPYLMGVYEVTQRQFESIMGNNPSGFGRSHNTFVTEVDRLPVECVSWYDAIEYCNKLSEKQRLTPCYALSDIKRDGGSIAVASVSLTAGNGYRLPTEAEWEYACRAGTTTAFNVGDSLSLDQAKVDRESYDSTAPRHTVTVGSHKPNRFGLFDMHGNVDEWCWDYYGSAYYSQTADPVVNPRGPPSGIRRVSRGGAWCFAAQIGRSADRCGNTPDWCPPFRGFRVARSIKR